MGRVGTCRLYSVKSVGSECWGWLRGFWGVGQMWVILAVSGLGRVGVGRVEGVGLINLCIW